LPAPFVIITSSIGARRESSNEYQGRDRHRCSALAPAFTSSSIHAQTAGDMLKAYDSLKKPERRTRLVEGAKKAGSSFTAPWPLSVRFPIDWKR
jgi:hypothetical protein